MTTTGRLPVTAPVPLQGCVAQDDNRFAQRTRHEAFRRSLEGLPLPAEPSSTLQERHGNSGRQPAICPSSISTHPRSHVCLIRAGVTPSPPCWSLAPSKPSVSARSGHAARGSLPALSQAASVGDHEPPRGAGRKAGATVTRPTASRASPCSYAVATSVFGRGRLAAVRLPATTMTSPPLRTRDLHTGARSDEARTLPGATTQRRRAPALFALPARVRAPQAPAPRPA